MNGMIGGINAEHIYPRSKGAREGIADGDMHNLVPAKADVNSSRGNNPFGEIPDSETVTWFFEDIEMGSIPVQNIDDYSERKTGSFEPREEVKGNIARAVFYFYTMYKDQADEADPNFFDIQKETLCNWHIQDPIDSLEFVRTFLIAGYQDNKPNPFILDCSLVERLYCSNVTCSNVAVSANQTPKEELEFEVFPNPSDGEVNFRLSLDESSNVEFSIYEISGKEVIRQYFEKVDRIEKIVDLPKGVYIFKVLTSGRVGRKIGIGV